MGLFEWLRNRRAQETAEHIAADLRAAAEAGDAGAQYQLGLHLSANPSAQNLREAALWYEKAAHQGHTMAQFNFAIMLGRGEGVRRDHAASLEWIRRAAEGGDPAAQFALGRQLHRTSIDRVAENDLEWRIEAYKWFRLAAEQGYSGSRAACDEMALHMTRDDVENGNRRVATFISRNTTAPRPSPGPRT